MVWEGAGHDAVNDEPRAHTNHENTHIAPPTEHAEYTTPHRNAEFYLNRDFSSIVDAEMQGWDLAPRINPRGQDENRRTAFTENDTVTGVGIPESRFVSAPTKPMVVARENTFLWRSYTHENTDIIMHYRGEWRYWDGTHWRELSEHGLKSDLYKVMEGCTYLHKDKEGEDVRAWDPDRKKISDLMDAMKALYHQPDDLEFSGWMDGRDSGRLISFPEGLVDTNTREVHPHDPRYLTTYTIPYSYTSDAPRPQVWLNFLQDVWGDDQQSKNVLQEWFGYVLSGRTDLQKMMFIQGPPRSGKGTIARVLTALVGRNNIAGPTLSSLTSNFGMMPMINATLALISDARLPNKDTETVVERLLSITGEDSLDVDRKNKAVWTGRVPARVMMMSNDVPPFRDASAAITKRMLVLRMTRSFLGQEDITLEDRLLAELSGILNWALEGLDRLVRAGRFTESDASAVIKEQLEENASPIMTFVDDRCHVDPLDENVRVSKKMLWDSWQEWCEEMGLKPGTQNSFGRLVSSALSGVVSTRPWIEGRKVHMYKGITLLALPDWAKPPVE